MNTAFEAHVRRVPALYTTLIAQPLLNVRVNELGKQPGIYILFDDAEPVHVGRTRNIRQRLRAHCTPKHNSASFAFKRARRELGQATTYSRATSRSALQSDAVFGPCFRKHVDAVAQMKLRFLEVSDPIDQYFLELYAALELGLPTDEFDTH
jgi:predicted GIY-YIG superfamily endonuclease